MNNDYLFETVVFLRESSKNLSFMSGSLTELSNIRKRSCGSFTVCATWIVAKLCFWFLIFLFYNSQKYCPVSCISSLLFWLLLFLVCALSVFIFYFHFRPSRAFFPSLLFTVLFVSVRQCLHVFISSVLLNGTSGKEIIPDCCKN